MPFQIGDTVRRKLCQWGFHKDERVYCGGFINGTRIDFIGIYCRRCYEGHDELIDTLGKMSDRYGTHMKKYFRPIKKPQPTNPTNLCT